MENSIPTIESRVAACKDLVASVQTALQAKAVKLATEVMQNFPEASTDWIRCTEYDYGLDEDGETQIRPAKYTFRVCNKDGDGRWTRVVTRSFETTENYAFAYKVIHGIKFLLQRPALENLL